MTAIDILEAEVRELVRARGIDPAKDVAGGFDSLLDEAFSDYDRRVEVGSATRLADPPSARREISDRIAGFGPLQALLDDPEIEEVWLNAPGQVFFARGGRHVLSNIVLDERSVRDLVERMLRSSGRRLDLSSPFVDANLRDGSRLHVAIPDVTARHWAVNIRKFVLRAHRLSELVELGSLDQEAAAFLTSAIETGLNIVVSGGTQTGKTTLLNCLASCIPGSQRVVTCEEVFELQIPLPDVVAMQSRQANLEGQGEIDLRRLIFEALRMRPDRIIVGEVRGREALDLLVALNSGLPGMTSIHANSALEALTKLTTLPLLAGENVTHAFVVPTVAAAVDVIVHLVKSDGQRRVQQIIGLTGRIEGSVIETVGLFASDDRDRLVRTGDPPPSGPKWAGIRSPSGHGR